MNPQEYLIVDGYNVIGASDSLRAMALADARSALHEQLLDYCGFAGVPVLILVFDAHLQPTQETTELLCGPTVQSRVVYTAQGEIADQYIERTVRALHAAGGRLRVATSDSLEQVMVMGYAARVSARELLADMEQARRQRSATHPIPHDISRRNALAQRLSSTHRDALEQLRRS